MAHLLSSVQPHVRSARVGRVGVWDARRAKGATWSWSGYHPLGVHAPVALVFLTRHVQYLPEYVPSAAEKADPDLYAANVRDAMAQGTGLVVGDRGRDPRGCGPWDDSPMESPCPTFLPFLCVLCLCLSASHRTVHAHRFVFMRFLQPRVCVIVSPASLCTVDMHPPPLLSSVIGPLSAPPLLPSPVCDASVCTTS